MDTIVEINKNNMQQVAELSVQLWPECSLAEMTGHFEEVLSAGLATCFLLQNETGYVGFIELSVRNDYVEGAEVLPVAYIEGLFVKEQYRHKGSGRFLLIHAEDWARIKGFKQLCSDTEFENEQSIGFHRSAGFVEVARIVCFAKNLD